MHFAKNAEIHFGTKYTDRVIKIVIVLWRGIHQMHNSLPTITIRLCWPPRGIPSDNLIQTIWLKQSTIHADNWPDKQLAGPEPPPGQRPELGFWLHLCVNRSTRRPARPDDFPLTIQFKQCPNFEDHGTPRNNSIQTCNSNMFRIVLTTREPAVGN